MTGERAPLIDASLGRGLVGIAIAGALFAVGFAIPMGLVGATSALVGAGLAAGNLVGIAYVVRGSLEGSVFSGVLGMTKIGLLFGATYVLIAKDVVGALPLAFGYASLPLGLILGLGLRDEAEIGSVSAAVPVTAVPIVALPVTAVPITVTANVTATAAPEPTVDQPPAEPTDEPRS